MTTKTIKKATKIGACNDGGVWVEISWNGERLSLMGVIGPRSNGNAKGGCGQIDRTIVEDDSFRANAHVSRADVDRLLEVWDRWHLNTMRAGTPAQEDLLRSKRSEYPGYPTSYYEWALEALGELRDDHGYRYGSAWLREDVPVDVIEFLDTLPDDTARFPWRERGL